jgi:uncharacterized protein YoxC
MQWIKAHLNLVICAAVSLVAIALIALGAVMSSVQETMTQDASLVQRLTSAPPVNERVVQELQRVLDRNTRQVETMQKKLEELGTYQPLSQDVFPAINPANPGARFQFGSLLQQAQREMVDMLRAGPAPSEAEKKAEQDFIDDQKAKAAKAASLGVTASPAGAPAGPGPVLRGPQGITPGITRPERSDLTPEQMAEQIGEVRASIRRARSIYCYLDSPSEVFGGWPTVIGSRDPAVEDMWYAQMALWIQQDVVKALAGLNDRVAESLKSGQQQPWVGNLPVKRIRRIVINGSVSPTAKAPATGGPAASETGVGMVPSFTGRQSSNTVDAIQFTVDLVVETRLLPAVIDEICKAGFFTPLMVNYTAVQPNLQWSGFLYGSSPVIQVRLDFEGCFLRAKYENWMPEKIKEDLQAGRTGFQQGGSAPRMPSGPVKRFYPSQVPRGPHGRDLEE